MQLLFLAAVALSTGCHRAGPSMRVIDRSCDIGLLKTEDLGHATFRIANDGDSPLRVLRVDTSCGCTRPSYPASIPPRGEGRIDVTFQAQLLWSGPRKELVHVFTNDPARPQVDLALTATLEPPITLQPQSPAAFQFTPGQPSTFQATITPREDKWRLTGRPVADKGRVNATLTRSGRAYVLTVHLEPSNEPGTLISTIAIPTSHPAVGTLKYQIVANPTQGPVAIPPVLSRNSLSREKRGLIGYVRVQGVDRQLRVAKATCSDPRLRIEVHPDVDPKATRVEAWYLGGWDRGPHQGTIEVQTSDSRFGALKVPFSLQNVF